jgi:hypothetical protein
VLAGTSSAGDDPRKSLLRALSSHHRASPSSSSQAYGAPKRLSLRGPISMSIPEGNDNDENAWSYAEPGSLPPSSSSSSSPSSASPMLSLSSSSAQSSSSLSSGEHPPGSADAAPSSQRPNTSNRLTEQLTKSENGRAERSRHRVADQLVEIERTCVFVNLRSNASFSFVH